MIDDIVKQLAADIELVPLLIWISSLLLLVALWVSQRSHSKMKKVKTELKQARNDLKALTASSLGIGRRLLEIERRQRRFTATQSGQHVTPVDINQSSNQPYDHAIYLAQQGKEVQEIISICGVSQNEAELIKMMHRLERAS